MKMGFFGSVRGVVFLAFWIAAVAPSSAQNNIWTKPTSGYWEEPFWSEGRLPSIADSFVSFTNAGWKALAIGTNTTMNYPASINPLAILIVDAPVDSHNLLLLNWAGLSVPLRLERLLSIGPNGSLLSHYSAIEATEFGLNGRATFTDFAESRFTTAYMGGSAESELNLSNGVFSAGALVMANGAPARFNQFGGSHQVSGAVRIGAEGFYNAFGGNFKAQSIELFPVRPGEAPRLNIAGGHVEVENELTLGGTVGGLYWTGMMTLSNGFFKGGDIAVRFGRVIHTGGTNQFRELSIALPGTGNPAAYQLTGGRAESARILLGSTNRNANEFGFFDQTNGVHSNSESLVAYGWMASAHSQLISGFYRLQGGLLFSANIEMAGGGFDQLGGTNHAERLAVINGGIYTIFGGALVSSNAFVGNLVAPSARPRFEHAGGRHHVKRLLRLDSGGAYDLRGGVLSAEMISIGGGAEFRFIGGGNVSSNNTFEIDGGTAFFDFDGNYSLGHLLFKGIAHISFDEGSVAVHFTRVGYSTGALDGQLLIHNWKGSTQAPGRHQLYIDTADANTPARVRLMTFVDPAGYPPGNYRARRKASGEIVPLEPPVITFTRHANRMVLTWPEGYQLYSADQITGPFQLMQAAQSGLSVAFSDPRRFFLLRPVQ